ncbi:hypothetical protein F5884DRAFT_671327 [Xylogone sp. PMI_703]|nr:hypothetical protein F5884DRAFT_671327 [Xylogone sp. PMI_703]
MTSLWNSLGRLLFPAETEIKTDAEIEEEITSPILRLPPEIILQVSSMLPILSGACFALCNHRLKDTLGHRFWKSLRSEPHSVMLTFLSLLEKDCPQYFVCQKCICLHRINKIKWPRLALSEKDLRCTWLSGSYQPLYSSPYTIEFLHIQLAMKQHCSSVDIGFPLEAFQYIDVEYRQAERRTTLVSVDAQIVCNEILIRSQRWILLPWNRRAEFIDRMAKGEIVYGFCKHRWFGSWNRELVSDLMGFRLDKLEAREQCSAIAMKCPHCWMDCVLDAEDFGERGCALADTTWIDLGAGLDPADVKWKNHALGSSGIPSSHRRGDIQRSFEEKAKLPMKELLADNRVKLFSTRQNRLVHQGPDGFVWKWDRSERWYLSPSGPPETSFLEFCLGW